MYESSRSVINFDNASNEPSSGCVNLFRYNVLKFVRSFKESPRGWRLKDGNSKLNKDDNPLNESPMGSHKKDGMVNVKDKTCLE